MDFCITCKALRLIRTKFNLVLISSRQVDREIKLDTLILCFIVGSPAQFA